MAITGLKKEDKQILERGGNYAVGQPGYDWPPFMSGQAGVHDYIECHIYDETGENLIESFITKDYEIKNNRVVTKPGNDLRSQGYIRGKYHVKYNFLREEFGTNEVVLVYADNNEVYTGPKRMYPNKSDLPWYIDDDNLIYVGIKGQDDKRRELLIKDLSAWIHKISKDRKEIRLIPNDIDSSRYKTSFHGLSKIIQRWNSPGPGTRDASITFSDGFGGKKIKIDGVKKWQRHTKKTVGGEFVLDRGFITHIERRVYEIERYIPKTLPRHILNEMPLSNQPLIPYETQKLPAPIKEIPKYQPSKPEPGGFDFVASMVGATSSTGYGETIQEIPIQSIDKFSNFPIHHDETVDEIKKIIEEDLTEQSLPNKGNIDEDFGGS